jgi:hypothetical protein
VCLLAPPAVQDAVQALAADCAALRSLTLAQVKAAAAAFHLECAACRTSLDTLPGGVQGMLGVQAGPALDPSAIQ